MDYSPLDFFLIVEPNECNFLPTNSYFLKVRKKCCLRYLGVSLSEIEVVGARLQTTPKNHPPQRQ